MGDEARDFLSSVSVHFCQTTYHHFPEDSKVSGLMVFENMVLRKMFELKREVVIKGKKNPEGDLIKKDVVARTSKEKNSFKIVVRKTEWI